MTEQKIIEFDKKSKRKRKTWYHPIEGEIWRPYENTEYLVSNQGRIRGKNQKLLLKPRIHSKLGCYTININNSTMCIHRIVAKVFVPGYDEANGITDVFHKNGNRLDNRAENLEWVTHSKLIRKNAILRKDDNIKAIYQYSLQGEFIKVYDDINECVNEYNVTRANILKAISGENKTCAGYMWSDHLLTINWQLRNKIAIAKYNSDGTSVVAIKEDNEYPINPHVGICKVYTSLRDCEQDGFDFSLVSKCIRGERNSHKGYKFYKDSGCK